MCCPGAATVAVPTPDVCARCVLRSAHPGRRVEYTEEDPKPQLEEACKVECLKEWCAGSHASFRDTAPGLAIVLNHC